MSLWELIRQRGLYSVVAGLYQQFPVDARGLLDDWVEHHVFSSQLNPDVHDIEYFRRFMSQMTGELDKRIATITAIDPQWLAYKKVLLDSRCCIQTRYENDPVALFRTLKYCLEQERRLLYPDPALNVLDESIGQRLTESLGPSSAMQKLFHQTQVILQQMGRLKDALRVKRELVNGIHGRIAESTNGFQLSGNGEKLNQQLIAAGDETVELKNGFYQQALHHVQILREIYQQLFTHYEEVLKELDLWKAEQRQVANGFSMTRNLTVVEKLVKSISSYLMRTFEEIDQAELIRQAAASFAMAEFPNDISQQHQLLKSEVLTLIRLLVIKTFIVETQPNQILRSKAAPTKQRQNLANNSPIRLRLLVEGSMIPNLAEPIPVTVSLISEAEARKHHDNPTVPPNKGVPLLNSKSKMEFNQSEMTFTAEFKGVALSEKIERRTKRPPKSSQDQEFVAAEKWCFFFTSELYVLNQKIPIETMSNPVCITCHPNQESVAWGSLFWDNAFAQQNRIPFEVPTAVKCEQLLDILSQKFLMQTGRGFSSDHRRFLTHKLLSDASTNGMVSWEMFNKKPIIFGATFWEYIYETMKLCEKSNDPKKHEEQNNIFQQYWAEGKVEGFISRDEMERKLRASGCDGEFMLRFSEHCLGSVTVVMYSTSYSTTGDIHKIEPYTLDSLKKLPLWSRIASNTYLKCLYPSIPKEQAFPEPNKKDDRSHLYSWGYIKTYLQQVIRAPKAGSRSRSISDSSFSTTASFQTTSGPSSSPYQTSSLHSVGSYGSPTNVLGLHSGQFSNTGNYSSNTIQDEAMEDSKTAITEAVQNTIELPEFDFDDLEFS